MNAHILVAYASRAGSTAEVAEAVGQVLRDGGASVDVRSAKEVQTLAGYDALVLGTAIWVGKPLPEATALLEQQAGALLRLPVAYFILCDTLREDTPEHRIVADGYVEPLRRIKAPVSVGLFAGKKDFGPLHPLLRWLLKHVMRMAEGDWRDWDAIRAWAADLGPCLSRRAPVAVPA